MKNGLIVNDYGDKIYYLNDQIHREDGPACEFVEGYKSWWQHGKRHRLDGPAIEYEGGSEDWYYQDQYIRCSSQEEFEKLIKFLAFI